MMTTLTPAQIALIQTTWAIPAQNAIDSGEAILLAYFEKYPKNQDKFSAFKNTPLLSLKVWTCTTFSIHRIAHTAYHPRCICIEISICMENVCG